MIVGCPSGESESESDGDAWRGECYIHKTYDFSTSRYWNVTLRGTMMYESHVNVPLPSSPTSSAALLKSHEARRGIGEWGGADAVSRDLS